jgi:hypothetical protein
VAAAAAAEGRQVAEDTRTAEGERAAKDERAARTHTAEGDIGGQMGVNFFKSLHRFTVVYT